MLALSFGYTVGKRVAPPAGTSVVLDVTGLHPVHVAVVVNADGRAVPIDEDGDPTVALTMDLLNGESPRLVEASGSGRPLQQRRCRAR
jgi:hypothetical protein